MATFNESPHKIRELAANIKRGSLKAERIERDVKQRLHADIEFFKQRGGRIEKIATGVSGDRKLKR